VDDDLAGCGVRLEPLVVARRGRLAGVLGASPRATSPSLRC